MSGEFSPRSWKDLPVGNVIPLPKTSLKFKTGNWRAMKPILHEEKCIKCLLCWVHCPEPSIERHEGDRVAINYDFCKGCGICANVCPVHAIEMVMEG